MLRKLLDSQRSVGDEATTAIAHNLYNYFFNGTIYSMDTLFQTFSEYIESFKYFERPLIGALSDYEDRDVTEAIRRKINFVLVNAPISENDKREVISKIQDYLNSWSFTRTHRDRASSLILKLRNEKTVYKVRCCLSEEMEIVSNKEGTYYKALTDAFSLLKQLGGVPVRRPARGSCYPPPELGGGAGGVLPGHVDYGSRITGKHPVRDRIFPIYAGDEDDVELDALNYQASPSFRIISPSPSRSTITDTEPSALRPPLIRRIGATERREDGAPRRVELTDLGWAD